MLRGDPQHQLLGFGTGDEHPLAHADPQAAELRGPEHVLHGAPRGQLRDEPRQVGQVERGAGVSKERRGLYARAVRNNREGDLARFVRSVEGFEGPGDAGEDVAACGHDGSVFQMRGVPEIQRIRSASAMAAAASATTAPRSATQAS